MHWEKVRMLRAILNKSWRKHPTRHQLYGYLPPIMKTIQVRGTRNAGHCWRSRDGFISDVLLWTPTYGRAKAGQLARRYIQQLCEDTRCSPEDLLEAMNDREKWRERVRDIRAGGMTWWWWWWYQKSPRSNTAQNSCTATYLPSLKPSKLCKQDMRDTNGEARMNSKVMFFNGLLYMDMLMLTNQHEHTYNSSVRSKNIVWKTCQEQWMIGKKEERVSRKSMLAVQHDDDDDDIWVKDMAYKKK